MNEQAMSKQTPVPTAASSACPDEHYSFARFWRCSLQVNPFKYQATYRGQAHGHDEDAYNQALLKKCLELGIQVIGIADHGSVESVDQLRGVLRSEGIVVFPGFEIASTEKIHMVCLFDEQTSTAKLNKYLGALGLADAVDGTRPSHFGCLELAKKIHELGGFWYAAHVTHTSGLLRLNNDGGGLPHIWRNSHCVRVAQIPSSPSALPEKYRRIIANENPDYRRDRSITLINAKDVAKPEDLEHPTASTWVKMTRPSFEAFKVAFLDPESRIRLSLAEAPQSALVSMRIHGGYLDGVEARFSDHLNALIGGRGTGKSTFIECLRYVLDLPPKGKQASKLHQDILKENLGKHSGTIELSVRSAAHHGKPFTISRRFGEPAIVRDASGAVSQQTPQDLLPQIEIYGQNEIFELAQDGPSRSRLLERFLPADTASAEQRALAHKRLAENAQRLRKARAYLDELTEKVARLPKLGEQLRGFQELGIEAKLAEAPLYARERQLVQRLQEELARLENGVQSLGEALPDLTFLSDRSLEGLPHAPLLAAMQRGLEELLEDFNHHYQALGSLLEAGRAKVAPHIAAWQSALAAGELELARTFAALPNMAGKGGREVGTAYQQLVQDIERTKPLESRRSTLEQLVENLRQERQNLIAELSDLRRARARKLQAAVQDVNQRLKGKLRIELRIEGDRTQLREYLVGCRLEGVGERRLAWIEEKGATPLALVHAIRGGAAQLVAEFGVTPMVADALATLPYSKQLELEAIELTDHVSIELNVARGDAEQYRDLLRLSTGQQCTAILHLLLLDNLDPLVVDQPEDNLDNAFIAERIVRELRDAKTRRQFLFSTHNANIPVFGDAEWIGVLTASESRGALEPQHQGSIDVPYIREQAAEILEGGRAAFTKRKEMYEF